MTTSADGVLRLFDPVLRPGSRLRTLPLGVTPSRLAVHRPTGKLLVLCCGRAKQAAQGDDGGGHHLRPRRLEPWQDTLRCVDPVTGAVDMQRASWSWSWPLIILTLARYSPSNRTCHMAVALQAVGCKC